MKRAWKFAAAAAGAVVLALIAVAAVAPLLVGDARYRAWVGEAVESRIGRELTISGDIEVRLLPRPRVVIADLALARARGYGEGRFAEIERLSADLALLPLLAGRVVVARLHVDGLRVELERDAAGRTNWADLLAARPAPGAGDTLGLPALGGLELDDATLVWRDRAAGEHLVLSVLHLHTGSLTAGGAVEVTANFRVADRVRGLRGVSRLAAELLPGADLAAIDVPRIELDGALVGATPAGRAIELAVRGDLRLDRRAALLTSSGIDVTASGPLDATFHAGIEANLRGARVLLTGVAAQARLAPGGSTRIDLTVRTDRPLAIDVAAASLDGGTLRVDARANGVAGLDVAFSASGALAGDLARQRYAWTEVTGSGEATRADGEARPIALAIGGDVVFDARDATLAVDQLHLAVAAARVSGGIEAAWPG
ncbi:MAG: AsmA family protein, partial [Gammaproteobacteria bacterium]|nr:AsmA family protein [Gammaproteobacteria bacterium]